MEGVDAVSTTNKRHRGVGVLPSRTVVLSDLSIQRPHYSLLSATYSMFSGRENGMHVVYTSSILYISFV